MVHTYDSPKKAADLSRIGSKSIKLSPKLEVFTVQKWNLKIFPLFFNLYFFFFFKKLKKNEWINLTNFSPFLRFAEVQCRLARGSSPRAPFTRTRCSPATSRGVRWARASRLAVPGPLAPTRTTSALRDTTTCSVERSTLKIFTPKLNFSFNSPRSVWWWV